MNIENIDLSVLDPSERVIYALRSLYMRRGYRRYRMSKFEEYDLYAKNKSFLMSEAVLTFTDNSGKLMALKPDVTLSIIKNTRDDKGTQRLCYNENVYRVSDDGAGFRELTQTGVECLGEVGADDIGEVLSMAAESLEALSESYIIEISDLDILSALLGDLKLNPEAEREILSLISYKNLHGIDELCTRMNCNKRATEALKTLVGMSLCPSEGLKTLKSLCLEGGHESEYKRFEETLGRFAGKELNSKIRLDFSLLGDMDYYNGIIFRGYIEGIPSFVLSGGQYDRLMKRMGRNARAIGFAVYLDRLDRLDLGLRGGAVNA